MNKKLFGISALLALVLAACGPSDPGTTSGTTGEPSDSGDTSDTSGDTSDSSGTTSEEPAGPALADVFEAFINLGANHTGEIVLNETDATFKYVKNADYSFVEGVGGVAKIDLGAQAGVRSFAPSTSVSEMPELAINEDLVASQKENAARLDITRADRTIERALEGAGRGTEEEEPEPEVKFFTFHEKENAFEAEWGAVYKTQSDFEYDASIASLFNDFNEEFETMKAYFDDYDGTYFVENATLVKHLLAPAQLNQFSDVNGFAEIGLTEEKPYMNFYSPTGVEPTLTIVFEAGDERYEALDNHLAAVTEYPTSPIPLGDVADLFSGANYQSIQDYKSILGSQYDCEIDTYSTIHGDEEVTIGESWGGVEAFGWLSVTDEGKELATGTYRYSGVKGENEISAENTKKYNDHTPFYDYYYNPAIFGVYKSEYVDKFEEYNHSFYTEDQDVIDDLTKSFSSITQSEFFPMSDEIPSEDGSYYLELHEKTVGIGLEYEMNDEGAVVGVLVVGYMQDFWRAYSTTKVDEYGDPLELPEYEYFDPDTSTYYSLEYFYNFGQVSGTRPEKFLGGLRDVVFGEEVEKNILLDVDETHEWNVSYEPAELAASYKSSSTTVAKVDSEGVITAKKAGKANVTATVGGASIAAEVIVKGISAKTATLKVGKGQELTNTINLFGVSGTLAAEIADPTIASVEPNETNDGIVVTGLENGENVVVTVTLTTADEKAYTCTFKVTVTPSITINEDDMFVKVNGTTEFKYSVLGAGDESAVEWSFSKKDYASIAEGEEAGTAVITGLKAGTVTVTGKITVGSKTYKDTFKLSVSDYAAVGKYYLNIVGAYVVVHEDLSLKVIAGETSLSGKWTKAEDGAAHVNAPSTAQEGTVASYGLDVTSLNLGVSSLSIQFLVLNQITRVDEHSADVTFVAAQGSSLFLYDLGAIDIFNYGTAFYAHLSVNKDASKKFVFHADGTWEYIVVTGEGEDAEETVTATGTYQLGFTNSNLLVIIATGIDGDGNSYSLTLVEDGRYDCILAVFEFIVTDAEEVEATILEQGTMIIYR